MIQTYDTPDKNGFFGEYGGAFIPPQLEAVMKNISDEYEKLKTDPTFFEELFD